MLNKVILQISIPPDKISLVHSHTLPKISSGKLRRSSCKQYYFARKLNWLSQSAFWQTIKLFIKNRARKIEKWLINLIKVVFNFYILILLFFTLLPVWLLVFILCPKKAAAVFGFGRVQFFGSYFLPFLLKKKKILASKQGFMLLIMAVL